MFGGIGSTIAQGMAFGTGSAMAHRAVDSVLGPRTIQHETLATEAPAAAPAAPAMNADACSFHSKAFQDMWSLFFWLMQCLNNYGSEISKCQFYLDMLNECRRGGVSV
ncbi:Cox19-like CHCH family protein [Zea mays]|uniref:Cox19-like CHCH family protein n=1 Tax=Zea mays TaxID=4577 RepID=A0A1D6KZK8_MAIZE|nr:Cox19-like CHCH family protein [Zea mays]